LKISYARVAISESLKCVAGASGAFVDFVARGLATRRGDAAFVVSRRVVDFVVVLFMTPIVATSMPAVPVSATSV
jgi:hypothetical protein